MANLDVEFIKNAIDCIKDAKDDIDAVIQYYLMDAYSKGWLDAYDRDNRNSRNNRYCYDDWSGCQGNCDFDPIPNNNGWI